jgi:hypothetical protein
MALNTITQLMLPDGKVIDLVDWTDKPIFSSLDVQTGFTASEMTLFQYVVGDTVPGFGTGPTTTRTANERDTNVQAPGSMASTEEMLVYAIKPEVSFFLTPDDPNNFTSMTFLPGAVPPAPIGFPLPTAEGLAVLATLLMLELEISQKAFAYASLGYFNTGFGVFSGRAAGADVTAQGSIGNLGLPSQEAVRSFVIPHHIGAQEKYRVNLTNPSTLMGGAVNFGMVIGTVDETVTYLLNPDVAATIKINLDGLYKRPVS